MKKLYLNAGRFETIFNDLKERFDGELTICNGTEYNLTFQSKWAKGTISGIRFDDRMTNINFDFVLNQEMSLSIESFPSAPVFFAFCENGSFSHSFGANGAKKSLKRHQTGILSNTSVINSVLYFESCKHIQFSLLAIPTLSAEEQNPKRIMALKEKFLPESGKYIYVGSENASLTGKWLELKTLPQQGVVRNLLKKEIFNEIIELEIARHSYNYLNTFDPILSLLSKPITEIRMFPNRNFLAVIFAAVLAGRNYLPRIFKEKYHLSYKPFSQKLAS